MSFLNCLFGIRADENLPFPDEPSVRMIRDTVYGQSVSDREWSVLKAYWMQPENVEWLREQVKALSVFEEL